MNQDPPGFESNDPQKRRTNPTEQNPWLIAGVVGALGFEFVGFMIVGALLGTWIDRRWEVAPYGLLLTMLLMLLSVSWHIFRIIQRFHRNGNES